MAEYIDREKLLDELGESASHHAENSREYQLLLRDRNIVREQPTADVIEHSKIDKATEEIKELYTEWENITNDARLESNPFGAVLNIIQRNIGE